MGNSRDVQQDVGTAPLPTMHAEIPDLGISAQEAFQVIDRELSTNADPTLNLGTLSTTWMESESQTLLQKVVGKNFIDQFAYPALEEIHQRVIGWIGQLFSPPDKCQPIGMATIGSSEAIMLGLLAHKLVVRQNMVVRVK